MPQKLLVCTDLDRTLLPNGKQPESPKAREYFARFVAHPAVTLAYVSGRDCQLVAEAIREYQLPTPHWVIGDVGTTIYQLSDGQWRHLIDWEENIAVDWRGLTACDLHPLFRDLPFLHLQEEAKQNRYKLSYYLSLKIDIDIVKQTMAERLEEKYLPASLIYSIDEADGLGLLDVLPAQATKLHAVEFLMRHLGFHYENTVFAGDSGNDLPVLISALPSVIVANADQAVIHQAKNQAQELGTLPAFYEARGNFKGMNGNYSAGILEGIAYYYPETLNWMEKNHA
jgi:sucrose-6-phosphatase